MARRPAETVSALTYRTGVQDANIAGNVHGGYLMKLCDDAAVIAATRFAGGGGVTPAGGAVEVPPPPPGGGPGTPRPPGNPAWRPPLGVGVRAGGPKAGPRARTHTGPA